MCRSTTTENGDFASYSRDRDRLKIRSFHLRFSISSSTTPKLPETLTLVYLPRINGNPLEINGAKIRADHPSFVALHRARSMEQEAGEMVYASVDRVRVGEAVRFEVYVGSQRAINGVFRRGLGIWGLECKSASEVDFGRLGISGGEVLVGGGERGVMMREKVEMERRRKRYCLKLEEIVEEGEREGCDCCCILDDDDDEEEEEEEEMVEGKEEEGMKWAMEMGIWVMCVGVGFLVSKASYEGLLRSRRKRILFK